MPPITFPGGIPDVPDEYYQDQEALYQQQKREEEERKRREEQLKLQEQQLKNQSPADPPREQFGPPGPDTVQQNRGPIGNFIEDRIVDVADFVDNTFQGDQKSKDQIRGERGRKQAEGLQTQERAQRSVTGELIRGVVGGVEDFGENTLEFLINNNTNIFSPVNKLVNDTRALLPKEFGGTEGKFQPVDVDIEFGIIPENTTVPGEAVRTISRYITSSLGIGALTRGALTAGKTGLGLIRGRAAEGALEATIAAEDDGSDTTLLGSTPFTKFLQTSEAKSPAENRALVMLDEAVFNVVGGAGFDAVGRLLRYTKALKEATNADLETLKRLEDNINLLTNELRDVAKGTELDKAEFNKFLEAAAKSGTSQKALDLLKSRREAQQAAKVLDDVYEYVTYGGPRTEKVADVIELDTAFNELDTLDQQLSDIDEFIAVRTKETEELIGQSLQADEAARLSLQQADEAAATGQAGPSPVSLSLSKAQVRLLTEAGLPEGVTITPGRRVQGLNSENIGIITENLNKLQTDSASKETLLNRLLKTGDEALGADLERSMATSRQLEQLRETFGANAQSLEEAQQSFLAKQKEIEEATKWRDTVRIQREALEARVMDREDQFAGKYIPVNLTTKNVTSIRKETAGARFQPGIDLYFEDKRFPALLNGKVKEVGFEQGYGNFIVVESVDYRTGKTVDVLYSHLKQGSNLVREGDSVTAGQQIATQGGTGRVRSADGTIASVDFLAPAPKGSGSMKPYSDWSGLADDIINRIKTGTVRVAQPSQAPTPRYSDTYVDEFGKAVQNTPDPAPTAKADPPSAVSGVSPSKASDTPPATSKADVDPDFPNAKVAEEALTTAKSVMRTGTREAAVKAALEPNQLVPLGSPEGGVRKASWTPGELSVMANTREDAQRLLDVAAQVERRPKYTGSDITRVAEDGERLYKEWLELPSTTERQAMLDRMGTTVDGNRILSSEENFATMKAMQSLADNLKELAKQADVLTEQGRPEASAFTKQVLDNMMALANVRAQHKITTSGKLREQYYAQQALRGNKPTSDEMLQMAEEYKARAAKDQTFYKAIKELKGQLNSSDPELVAKAIRKANRVVRQMSIVDANPGNFNRIQTMIASIGTDVNKGFTQSILSGPITQARNFWGGFYQSVGHPTLAALGEALPGKGNEVTRRQAFAALGATYDSFREIRSILPQVWKNNENLIDPDGKFFQGMDEQLINRMNEIKRAADAGELNFFEKGLYSLSMVVHKLYNYPPFEKVFQLMGTVDSFFEVVAGRQIAARRAVEAALIEMKDAPLTAKRSKAFGDRVAQLKEDYLKDIFDEKFQLKDDEAKALANVFTFKVDLKTADPITKTMQSISNTPFMKVVGIPFVQTPSAILRSSLRITPGLSTVLKNMDEAYKNGDDFYRAMRDGEEALSYLILLGGFTAGTQGVITGAGPLAGDERRRWLQNHDPFTIYGPGGVKFNYQGLEPAATIIGLMADAGAILKGDREREGWMAIGPAIFSNVINKSYLTQLTAITNVLESYNESNLKNLGRNALALVPFQGLRSQTGQLIDQNIRELRSSIEPFWSWAIKKSGGLGLSGLAPAQIDRLTGEELTRDGYEGDTGTHIAFVNMAAPLGLRLSKNRFKPIHKKMFESGVDLNRVTREVLGTELTNEEMSEFSRLMAGDGALERSLNNYFQDKNSSYKIDMEESLARHKDGLDWKETPVYKNVSSIVREHAGVARAIFELGQTPVSAGFAARRNAALKQMAERDVKFEEKKQMTFDQLGF